MVENGKTIGRITPQERGEVDVDNSRLKEVLGRVTNNWQVKFLLVPTLSLIASIPSASQLPELRTVEDVENAPPKAKLVSGDEACPDDWEFLGCADWGQESCNDDFGCSVNVVREGGKFCVYQGPPGACAEDSQK